MRIYLFSLVILIFTSSSLVNISAQNPPDRKFIQFVFTNLDSPDKAHEIDNFIRSQSGVSVSRCDIPSKKFLLIYYENSDISLAKVITWMNQFEMEFKCINEGVYNVDPIIDQKIDCKE